ncbi:MAG: alpha/beta fold hydrolase [Candidatus Sumerlaeota bacterium]|nr:alpha/beta fold hydrolase [Candidatus Sumerlaeota bacterium]
MSTFKRIAAGASMLGWAMPAAGIETNEAGADSPAQPGVGVRPLADSEDEPFPDGSTGRISEFRGCEGTYLPAYVRKPKGDGPFPAVVLLHGGAVSKEATYGTGRGQWPAAHFIAAGWAIVAIDYRPTKAPLTNPAGAVVFPSLPPIEWNDTLAAIGAVRSLPFVDGKRVAVMGGSHGGYVMSKVVSRTDLSCAIFCAPAIFDLIELSKAMEQGVNMAQVIKNKVAEGEQKYGAPMAVIARNPAAYGYESAMTEAANVRCPILIINGRNDHASPVSVMQAYVDKLHALGKEAETYFPDNGPHGFYWGIKTPIPETEESTKRAVAFIRKHFAP